MKAFVLGCAIGLFLCSLAGDPVHLVGAVVTLALLCVVKAIEERVA